MNTVPGILSSSLAVDSSCVREQSAMSPAPTNTVEFGSGVMLGVGVLDAVGVLDGVGVFDGVGVIVGVLVGVAVGKVATPSTWTASASFALWPQVLPSK